MIDAGVEEDVVEYLLLQIRKLHGLSKAAEAATMIRHGAAPCGMINLRSGKSQNTVDVINCMKAVVSPFR